jgi:hypothetical protein
MWRREHRCTKGMWYVCVQGVEYPTGVRQLQRGAWGMYTLSFHSARASVRLDLVVEDTVAHSARAHREVPLDRVFVVVVRLRMAYRVTAWCMGALLVPAALLYHSLSQCASPTCARTFGMWSSSTVIGMLRCAERERERESGAATRRAHHVSRQGQPRAVRSRHAQAQTTRAWTAGLQ